MPRITVTGVRSSCPSREISSWRRAARSSRASCAISSWRVRRRSRSRASVSSSITVGVTSGRDHAAARGRLPHGVQDLVAVAVLQHVARCAGHQHLAYRPLVLGASEGHDAERREPASSARGWRRCRPSPASARPSARRRARARRSSRGHRRRSAPGLRRSSPRCRGASPVTRGTRRCRRRAAPVPGARCGGRVATLAGKATSLMQEVSARTADDGIQPTPGSLRGTRPRSVWSGGTRPHGGARVGRSGARGSCIE